MALETLIRTRFINGNIVAHQNEENNEPMEFIKINHVDNSLFFKIQKGAIKEVGVNGCQIDAIIETAKLILEGLNSNFPCRENSIAITKLDEALMWLDKRKKDRIERNVEGTSNQ
jgi:hypothetical protein